MDHNRHEDAVLQRGAGNALTMSGLLAYHNRPVSHYIRQMVRGRSLGVILTNVKTSEKVRKGEV